MMKKLVAQLVVVALLMSFAMPVFAQESVSTFKLSLREMTTAQKVFLFSGPATVILGVDDEFANTAVIIGAITYEFLREDKSDSPVESALINVFLFYASRAVTSILADMIR